MGCAGYYNYDKAYTPKFNGAENFKGQVIHPQFWPDNFDYADKKVVVIGSGATAALAGHVPPDGGRQARWSREWHAVSRPGLVPWRTPCRITPRIPPRIPQGIPQGIPQEKAQGKPRGGP